MQAVAQAQAEIADEDALRAHTYRLLARLMSGPPTPDLLQIVRGLEGDETPFGQALSTLAKTARATTEDSVGDEFFLLFIGVGKSELLPYGSYYITGFLNEWPVAKLIDDMRALGIARADDSSEPEDHIAALSETMAGLITGDFGPPAELTAQRKFFDTHIGNWAPNFFTDLEAAKSAAFYMPVGSIGRLFMEIEAEGFRMTA